MRRYRPPIVTPHEGMITSPEPVRNTLADELPLTGSFKPYRGGPIWSDGDDRQMCRCAGCNCLHHVDGTRHTARNKDFCEFCFRELIADPAGFITWKEKTERV